MKIYFVLIGLLITLSFCIREEDKVAGPPGMNNTVVYSGFLDTQMNDRKLHYVFVQAEEKPQEAPLTIWLNGGPGCSSLIGFMQEIGPYLVGNTYNHGDMLTKNEYRWNKASNILFIESPGSVGFSTDKNFDIIYTDNQTADDCFKAVQDFIWNVAPEFKNRQLFITGQSYAGKYIPDLTVRILDHNRLQNVTYINLKGIMIGNGIMNHLDSYGQNSLTRHKIIYMIDHDFISERLVSVYQTACSQDFYSPRCMYFQYQFELLKTNLNRYNIYEVCQNTGITIEDIKTQEFIRKVSQKIKDMKIEEKYGVNSQKPFNQTISLKEINRCPSDDGMIDYLNQYQAVYNVLKSNKTWEPCTDINYDILVRGSMDQFRQIFLNKAIKVWLFSGDWDQVVPYPDTAFNLELLKRKKTGPMQPWFIGQNHAGFYQLYDSLNFITVKGASHFVPIAKPAAAYQMFYNFIKDRPINTPV